jgi:hypothetical protein
MSETKTTRLVTVHSSGGRRGRTIHRIELPGSPRLLLQRYWNNGATSYHFEGGSRLVLSREENDRLQALARGKRKPFTAEVEEGVVGTDWYTQQLFNDADIDSLTGELTGT